MSKINFFLVNKDHEGRRLDNFLFSKFKKGIPKSKIYSSIRKAKIKVNGRKTKHGEVRNFKIGRHRCNRQGKLVSQKR